MSNELDLAGDPCYSDLCRIRETVLMLNLAVAQISGAMIDGDDSIDVLSNSFTSMMTSAQTITQLAGKLPEGDEQQEISQHCTTMIGQMQDTIVAFQFYDKLSQRLIHLTNGLTSFAELVGSPELVHNSEAWSLLQENIKSRYTLETDKAMFDAILEGKSIEEALNHLAAPKAEEKPANDIDLF